MTGLTPINNFQIYSQHLLQNNLNVDKAGGKIALEELQKTGLQGLNPLNKSTEVGFERILNEFVQQVNEKQEVANSTVKDLLSGKEVSLHQAVIAMEEANVAFSLMVEVRNKLIEAYQELMRMQM